MRILFYVSMFALIAACAVKKPDQSKSNQKNAAPCRTSTISENSQSACKIRLLTPRNCEEIDLTGGKTYTFSWTSDTTYCQAPYRAMIAGNPSNTDTGTNANFYKFDLSNEITHYGGTAVLSAENISNLQSADGTFEWALEDPQHSHPAGVVFSIKR